jgi:hypothetical protein
MQHHQGNPICHNIMNIGKLKGPEKMLQRTGKRKVQEHKSGVLQ